ncbi:MAG: DUF2917 domain-containing protein [Comamonas sp.]|jgi:hypothetical protein|uniref:DUF2917 domain-containing protein n=1 Tax=Comamonas sp. TaxID=34028 RepID=UPI0012D023E0|nr:DUF2917 domain-containing protein [Comamonas sp.]MDR3067465.1 DUF2917 domain-containing protein [Comamonas sp.]MPS94266.1 DUF2917 domain-containing protein [Comamonas sp.]
MNSATAPHDCKTLSLQASASVQAVPLNATQRLWVQARSGIVWLTCEGQPRDYFLHAGESLCFAGPARVYLGAQGSQSASLCWSLVCAHSSDSAAAAAAPAVSATVAAA